LFNQESYPEQKSIFEAQERSRSGKIRLRTPLVQTRDENNAAYAIRLAAQRSVVIKNRSTSPHQRRAVWSNDWQKF